MNTLVICTTAICRPELHNISIPAICNHLIKITGFKIHWIINIDNCFGNAPITQEDTKNNFEKIIPEFIKKYFIIPDTPSHPIAINNIYKCAMDNELLDKKCIYFWLEDDWVPTHGNFNIKLILSNMTPNQSHSVNLLSLNPTFMGINFFSRFVNLNTSSDAENQIAWKLKKEIKKSSVCFIDCHIAGIEKSINKNNKRIAKIFKYAKFNNIDKYVVKFDNSLTPDIGRDKLNELMSTYDMVFTYSYFSQLSDIGRNWIKSTNLIKWDKNNLTSDLITYSLKDKI